MVVWCSLYVYNHKNKSHMISLRQSFIMSDALYQEKTWRMELQAVISTLEV